MKAGLLQRELLPFLLTFCALVAAALMADGLIHALDAGWIGRYLGIAGALLILGSFGYSLRKRKWILAGRPAAWLRVHEAMAWSGSLLVLVHAGVHFNALLGWLAIAAMGVNVGSGLTGKFLLDRSRRRLEQARRSMQERALPAALIEERMYWDSLAYDLVRRWRVVHLPITGGFVVLAMTHIVAELLFWGWR
jgi:hypothetical protein